MRIIYYLLITVLVLGMNSCTKELPYPDIEEKSVLVLNGLISPGVIPSIHLSESCHITDLNCEGQFVGNAQVFLKDASGTVLTEMIHEASGIYVANGFNVEYNMTYTVEAQCTGFETISASAEIPNEFNSIMLSNDEGILQEHLCRTFEVEIEDADDEINYYLINGWVDILNGDHFTDSESELNGYILPHTGFVTNDVNVDNSELTSTLDVETFPMDFIFLTDENINGQDYVLDFGLYDWDIFFDKDYELIAHISVKSATQDVYDYFKSIALYKLNNGNPFAEPEQILSNVQNGIGFFGGYASKEFVVELPQTEYYLPYDGDPMMIENEGCTGPCIVNFSTDVGNKVDVNWDFGDGQTSIEQNPSHEYQTPGNYQVELNITLGETGIFSSRTITIN